MSRRRRTINRQTLLRFLGTALALSLLVYLLSRQGWDEISASIRQITMRRFLIAGGLILLSRGAVSGRWYALLQSSTTPLPFKQVTRITFAGLFAANFLPTTVGGDVVRLAGALQTGGDRAVIAASIVVDRLVGLFGMATALPFGAPSLWAWAQRGGALSGALAPAGFTALLPPKWGHRLWQSIRRLTRRLGEALGLWIRRPQSLLKPLGFSWAHMACKFVAIQILFAGMDERISFWLVAGLWSFTYFVTLFPLSINGLGLQEVSMAFIYANLGDTSLSSALIAALAVRTLEMAASLPGVLFLPTILSGMEAKRPAEVPYQDLNLG